MKFLVGLATVAAGLTMFTFLPLESANHAAPEIQTRHQHRPMALHGKRDATSSSSFNWSGYAVTGSKGSVTDVKGSWIVPAVTCTGSDLGSTGGYSSFWIGIDGWNSSTVEQLGTDSDCVSAEGTSNTPTYYAWYEFYPKPSMYIGNPTNNFKGYIVQPGDVMSAEVKAGSRSSFTVTISNQTKGWTFARTSSVSHAQQSSAEWIAEAPSGCNTAGGFCPLPDFGTIDFGSGFTHVLHTSYATVSGKTLPLGSFSTIQEAVMVNYPSGATIMAQPSAVEDGNTSFSVQWNNYGP